MPLTLGMLLSEHTPLRPSAALLSPARRYSLLRLQTGDTHASPLATGFQVCAGTAASGLRPQQPALCSAPPAPEEPRWHPSIKTTTLYGYCARHDSLLQPTQWFRALWRPCLLTTVSLSPACS